MKAVYVLTTPDRLCNKIFKIGRTTQTQEDLRKRYKTSLIEPLILSYIPVKDEVQAESRLHNALQTYRLSNSEWFQCELGFIMTELCKLQLGQEKETTISITTPMPAKIDYEQKERYRRLYYWIRSETPFADFLVTQAKPYIKGFYKLQHNNFWTPLNHKPTFKNNLYRLLKRTLACYPDFSNELSLNLHCVENPLLLCQRNKVRSFSRKDISFSLHKNFLLHCVSAIISITMDRTVGRMIHTLLKTPFQQSSHEIYFMNEADQLSFIDLKAVCVSLPTQHSDLKTINQARNTGNAQKIQTDSNQARNLIQTKILQAENNAQKIQTEEYNIRAVSHDSQICLWEKPLVQFVEKDFVIVNLFNEWIESWVPDRKKLKVFKTFVRDCLIDQTCHEILIQKTKMENSLMFSSKEEDIHYVEQNISSCADDTLIGEFAYTLLNLFFKGSALRIFGKDAMSWNAVKNYIQNTKLTNYPPRFLLIYSSSLTQPTKQELFNNLVCDVHHNFDHETFHVDKQRIKPNIIIIRPEKRFENFAMKEEENVIPFANTRNIDCLLNKYPTFLENITTHTLWQALYWFLS